MQRLPVNFRFQFCLFVGAFVHTIRCAAFVCRFYAVNCNVCRAFFPSDSDDKTVCFRQKKLKRTGTPLNYSKPAFPFITRSIFVQVLRPQNLQRTVTSL